jgi:hypothetical protein
MSTRLTSSRSTYRFDARVRDRGVSSSARAAALGVTGDTGVAAAAATTAAAATPATAAADVPAVALLSTATRRVQARHV